MRHIYLHVPFCARRCSYCDFSIAVRKHIPAARYVDAISTELNLRRSQRDWDDSPLETLYFGGGTPSLLPPEQLGALIRMLTPDPAPIVDRGLRNADLLERSSIRNPQSEIRNAVQPEPREVTVEANPDDVTPATAAAWKNDGVNRISLGIQSFDPAVLRWMHRTHDADAGPRAVEVLRNAGIDRISLDLIFGLPEELEPDLARDLEAALTLEPDHLSVYGLSVEARTPLARWISRGTTTAPTDDRYAREFLLAHETLTRAGFEHYEVSNFARPGHRSRHNGAYWLDRPYAGLGPAAHSYSRDERRWNLAAWAAYERALGAGQDPTAEREVLTPAQRSIEKLYLGLRTVEGVEEWQQPASIDKLAQDWKAKGWLAEGPGRFRLTAEGWLRLDQIVTVLTTSADGG